MMSVEWKAEYEIGNGVIDEQHQFLFQIANRIFQILGTEEQVLVLSDLFDELFKYTNRHFREEEVIWRPLGEEIFQAHRTKHLLLRAQLEAIWLSDSIFNPDKTAQSLYDWVAALLQHVLNFDRGMNRKLLDQT
ncbi:MAG: hemerythrin domain-containing protein [Magnetococcales bacterium]|nr:hemerythrin domain-containing protein [Magnetococcales bacterium]MBF0261997.1 hemerythrin domain-containing protein [Magnetococcales bacterium]